MKKLISLMALFVISLLTVSLVSAGSSLGGLGATSVNVKVNDEENDGLLTVEEGEELDVEVELVNNACVAVPPVPCGGNAENVKVEARLLSAAGYDEEDPRESTTVSITEGTKKTVRLKLKVPNDFPNGPATLKVIVSGGVEMFDVPFNLHVESPSHSVKIADVSFSPSLTVKAGRSLLTTVLLENVGENDEQDVKVTVAVPELGVSASEYVEKVLKDDREAVDELFLQVPADAPAGEYTVKVTAQYDDLEETVTETFTLKVLANELLQPKTGKLVLAVGPETQTVAAAKTASYAVALTNEGSASKAYLLEVATGDWATASVSESLVVLEPGKNKVVYVDLAVNADATFGEHLASVTVKSGSDVLETVVLKANVVQGASAADSGTSLRNGLEIALIVLVVLLVLMGLVIGFGRLRKDDDGEEKYY